jgi:CubicO group peptidase (beta-lactamase class C family)
LPRSIKRSSASFPDHSANGPLQETLTVGHLLDMASGIQWQEHPYNEQSDALKLWKSKDWLKFILDRQVSVTPGEKFQYIAAAPHLLSAILTGSTGANAAEYARQGLFKSLGIEDFAWSADPKGHTVGESSLRLKPRDMAKLGLLYSRRGRWEDRQLLPPDWTATVFAGGLPNGYNPMSVPSTYSRLWWTDASVPYAAALGRHGQNIIVLPEQDVVLVVTSKTADTSRRSLAVDMVKRYLLPAIKGDAALPEDSAGTSQTGSGRAGFGRCGQARIPTTKPTSRSPGQAHLRSGTERLAASRIRAGAFRPRSKFSTRTSRPDLPFFEHVTRRPNGFCRASMWRHGISSRVPWRFAGGGSMGTPSGGRLSDWRVPSSWSGLRNSPTGDWRFPMWTATVVHSKSGAFRRSE